MKDVTPVIIFLSEILLNSLVFFWVFSLFLFFALSSYIQETFDGGSAVSAGRISFFFVVFLFASFAFVIRRVHTVFAIRKLGLLQIFVVRRQRALLQFFILRCIIIIRKFIFLVFLCVEFRVLRLRLQVDLQLVCGSLD